MSLYQGSGRYGFCLTFVWMRWPLGPWPGRLVLGQKSTSGSADSKPVTRVQVGMVSAGFPDTFLTGHWVGRISTGPQLREARTNPGMLQHPQLEQRSSGLPLEAQPVCPLPSRQDHFWSTAKRAGAKLKGYFKIRVETVRPVSKGTDRCDSLWVPG